MSRSGAPRFMALGSQRNKRPLDQEPSEVRALRGLLIRETQLSVASGFIRIAGEQCDLVALRVAKVANIKMRTI